MSHPIRGASFRTFVLAAAIGVAGCAVAPGPVEQQAAQANQACLQGIKEACGDAAALQPAASAERARAEQNAQIGTAVAAGVIGAAAGAAIVGATAPRGRYYGRPYYRRW